MLPVRADCLTTGGRCEMCRKTVLVQVDVDSVNHCDPQLIDLFGAKDQGPEQDILQGIVFKKNVVFFFLTMTADNLEAGGALC